MSRPKLLLSFSALLLVAFSLTLALPASDKSDAHEKIMYPKVKTVDHVDDYNGVQVADPYHWLEDANSADTKAWVEEENKLTFSYLDQIPVRAKIKERLTKLWNYERYGVPETHGKRYFYSRNDGLQNQNVVYWADSLSAEPKVLLDPNKLSTDGTVALSTHRISDDGKLMVYGLAAAGSDWQDFKVRDVATGQDLPDEIHWVKFSGASWTKDAKGFVYSRYDEPNEATKLQTQNYYQKLYYHKLGTPQSDDALIYDRKDQKEWQFNGEVSDDGRYLFIHVSQGTDPKNRLYYKDLSAPSSEVVKLLDDYDAEYIPVGNDGPVFYLRTDNGAPRNRVIAIDTRKPDRANWKTIIPESKDTIEQVTLLNNVFIATYLHDAHSAVRIFDKNGKQIREVQLPGIGTVMGFDGRPEDKETFYSYTSFNTPSVIYHYDVASGKSTVFRQPKVDFNPNDYETRQVFYKSKDGTRIPMFITAKKGLKLDGNNPTYLYGYGGFNISLTPNFTVANLVWMEMGGIYAVPNLRGGGEYGKEWHEAGMKLHKQNVFDDFIAAAEYLIANRYTSTPKLAIGGGSNGGLLVGACLTQRPDLYGATLPAVGVMDMLRFNKFTIGWAWTSDYGSPENPEEFKAIRAYSPLHNIKPGVKYPSTLITTADHDDRVVPAHSFKFASTLQAAQAGDAPVLIRIETRAGHGAGKPTSKIIEETADKWGFLVHVLGMEKEVSSELAGAQAK